MSATLTTVRPWIDPGLHRERRGHGFAYLHDDGSAATAADMERIHHLVLPPAWTKVWVSADPGGHIQAVGIDAAGREQYRYHPEWKARHALRKFQRALELAAALPHARATVTKHLRQSEDDRSRTLATAFRFLDDASPRIGTAAYLDENGSRGLTTLLRSNATVDSHRVTLSFPGKEHVHNLLHMTDADLAAVVTTLIDGPADELLLGYLHQGHRAHLTPSEVNDYIRETTGGHYSAKDFRTLRGTVAAAETLAKIGPVTTEKERKDAEHAAVVAASEALNNTPAVAKSSYVDPRVFAAYALGNTVQPHTDPDVALRRLLEE